MTQAHELRSDAGQRVADGEWVARARELVPVIVAGAESTERERQVSGDVMAALHGAGL